MVMSRFARILVIVILVWEFGVLCLEASRTPLWYDELLTLHVSGLQPFSYLWTALQAGADRPLLRQRHLPYR